MANVRRRLGHAMIFGLLAAPGAQAAGPCLTDNVANQSAVGRLSIIKAQDAAGRPERPYIVKLIQPACLAAADPADRVDATSTIHIYATEAKLSSRIAALVGKMVMVSGRPFAAHTAHHHAPIVMEISAIHGK